MGASIKDSIHLSYSLSKISPSKDAIKDAINGSENGVKLKSESMLLSKNLQVLSEESDLLSNLESEYSSRDG